MSRWMFWRSEKKEFICNLEKPVFTNSEKATLKSIMDQKDGRFLRPYWGKVHDYLLWCLTQELLNGRLGDEARKGYLSCILNLDNLPIYEYENRQQLEDDGTNMMNDF